MSLARGIRLGPYELLSPIGAGGMGEVWKARDTRLDRVVAVKFTHSQFSDRFGREARAIAALNHPNIAQIYDVGENYIVMEFVDGEPIRAPGNTRKLLDIAVQIADGLAAAHNAGFVHRDLKPDNILLTRDGRVKILDFGLARQATAAAGAEDATRTIAITNPGTVLGTVAYMSPEQARGHELDPRSDQFSFGIILYELATGKRAFQRASAAETMTAIIREEPEPLPATIPAPLRWTIERLLSKDPNDRYASTKDLFAELRGTLGRISAVSTLQPTATLVTARKQGGLLRAVLWGAAVLALTMLAAALFRRPSLDASHYRFTPFATSAAHESYPVWSPDVRSIAYLESTDAGTRIVVKRVDRGATPVAILRASAGSVSWSPDGERIYYNQSSIRGSRVLSASRAGGEATVILDSGPFEKTKTSYNSSALSPDGKTLALLVIHQVQNGPERRLALSTPPGAAPRLVGDPLPCCVTPTFLSWSPYGSRLLVRVENEARSSLRVMTPDGYAKVVLEWPFGEAEASFSWVGTSRYIAMSSLSAFGQDQGLHLLDSETGKISPLVPSATPLMWPAVSRDGSRVAYVWISRQFELEEIPLSGEPVRPLAPSHIDQHSIAFSPKRDEFAFVRLNEIIVHNQGRNEERVLLSTGDFPGAATQGSPSWLEYSPDGERILFTCTGCEKRLSIWNVPASGGAPAKVVGGGDGGWGGSWSPDGQWIVYNKTSDGRDQILAKIRVGNGDKPVNLTCGTGCAQPANVDFCGYPSWSPTGEWILCPGFGGSLKLISPDGATNRVIGKTAGRAAWSRDGRYIYNTRREGARSFLERVDPASGQATTVLDLPPGFRPSSPIASARLSVSADGKSLAISTSVRDGDIWILDGFEPPRSLWERLWQRKP